MQQLLISAFLWANTLALGSCLCDNRSKTRQRQAVVLSSIPAYKPSRKPLRPLRPLRLCVPSSHFSLPRADARKATGSRFSIPLASSLCLRASLFSVFRRRPQRERLNHCTRCFRLTRSTEDKGALF